jgi:hypothetical protein
MVRKLGVLLKFLVFNSGRESFRNISVFTFFLTVVHINPELQFAFPDCNGKWMLPFVNAIATLLHCVYLIQSIHQILMDMCKYLMMQSSI